MSTTIEIFFCRQSIGSLDLSTCQTMGDLIANSINMVNNKNSETGLASGEEIVNTPPTHSNWSFLLLGKRERYISSLSLTQIDQIKALGLGSPVYRMIDEQQIPDIPYNSSEKLYIFHRLPDWHRMVLFDQSQAAILKSHHQFLKTQNRSFRTENQTLRQILVKEVRIFIAPTIDDKSPVFESESKPDADGNSFTERPSPSLSQSCSEPHQPVIHPPKQPDPPNLYTPPRGGALPGFVTSSPARMKPQPQHQPQPAQVPKEPLSLIDRLNQPSEIMAVCSEDQELTKVEKDHQAAQEELDRTEQELIQVAISISKAEEEDFRLAQALHFQLNDSSPPVSEAGNAAIQRMVEAGVAVNALTGN